VGLLFYQGETVPTSRASLPDPSGYGFFLSLLLLCVLVAINGVLTTSFFTVFARSGIKWLDNPRFGQPILFSAPLLMLVAQLWLASLVGGYLRRRRTPGE
jgi:hypothetical protein